MVVEIETHRLVYVPLPKAGCTTLKRALSHIDPSFDTRARAFRDEGDALFHKVYPTRRFRADRWVKYAEGWHRFCVIRDPLERVISCYVNRVLGLRELHKSPRMKRLRPDLPRDPDPDFFFQNIKTYARLCSTIQHHILPVHTVLGIRSAAYDMVYRLEDIDTCLSDLQTRSGTSVKTRKWNESEQSLTLDDLQPETRAHLADFLAFEYRDLKRWYPKPSDLG